MGLQSLARNHWVMSWIDRYPHPDAAFGLSTIKGLDNDGAKEPGWQAKEATTSRLVVREDCQNSGSRIRCAYWRGRSSHAFWILTVVEGLRIRNPCTIRPCSRSACFLSPTRTGKPVLARTGQHRTAVSSRGRMTPQSPGHPMSH